MTDTSKEAVERVYWLIHESKAGVAVRSEACAMLRNLEKDLATALAEIERLKGKLQARDGECKGKAEIIAQLEAERDEAVAAAYEAAAIRSENYARGAPYNQRASINALANSLRGMTPAHAKAALEAYGREKVREGMQRVAEIIRGCCPECQGTGLRDSGGVQPWGEHITVPCDCADAILAGMEKGAGNERLR